MDQDFGDVLGLHSYIDSAPPVRAMSISVGGGAVLSPEIVGANRNAEGWVVRKITDTTIPQMLNDESVGRWLTRETDTRPLLDADPEGRKFVDARLMIGDDPSDIAQGYAEARFKGNAWAYGAGCRTAELPYSQSLLVIGDFNDVGNHLYATKSRWGQGRVDSHGDLPLRREYLLEFRRSVDRDVRLSVKQGSPPSGGNRTNVTILKLDQNDTKDCDRIKLVFGVNQIGSLSLLATDESTGRELTVRQMI